MDTITLANTLRNSEAVFVPYCAFTSMPFVICDPDTFEDQVWIFETEELMQTFAKTYTEKKILLKGVKVESRNALSFYTSLHYIGITQLVYVTADGKDMMELSELIRLQDYSNLPASQRPLVNKELQLSSIYFLQEARRGVPMEEKESIKELDEEFTANLVKSSYILPVELQEGPESREEKLKNRQWRFAMIRTKDEKQYYPIFADALEFSKFNKERKFEAFTLPFAVVASLSKTNVDGYLLNPLGCQIVLPNNLIDLLVQQFQVEIPGK